MCKNSTPSQSNIHYHGLPRDPAVSEKWIEFIKKQNKCDEFIALSNTYLCSDHFKDDFKGLRRLKKGAIPSIPFISRSDVCELPPRSTTTVCASNSYLSLLNEYTSVTEISKKSFEENEAAPTVFRSNLNNNASNEHTSLTEINDIFTHEFSSYFEVDMNSLTNQNQHENTYYEQKIFLAPETVFYSEKSIDEEDTQMQKEDHNIMEIDNSQYNVQTLNEEYTEQQHEDHNVMEIQDDAGRALNQVQSDSVQQSSLTNKKSRKQNKKCSAKDCGVPEGSFFSFPSIVKNGIIDPDALTLLKLWIQNSGNIDLLSVPSADLHKRRYLCSKHFTLNQCTNTMKNRLQPNAKPTLFSCMPLTDSQMSLYPIYNTQHATAALSENHQNHQVPDDEFIINARPYLDEFQQKFHEEMSSLQWKTCDNCSAKFLTKNGSDRRCVYSRPICDKFKTIVIDEIPEQLKNLTYIEEQLISKIHPIVSVIKLKGHQLGYQGNVINFPQDVKEFARALPHKITELSCVLTIRASKNLRPVDFQVRAQKVKEALIWLKHNNRFYFDVEISESNIDALPENDNVFDLLNGFDIEEQIEEPALPLPHNDLQTEPTDPTNEILEDIYDSGNPIMTKAVGSDQIVSMLSWPTISNQPINEFNDESYIVQAFPCLFPKGNGNIKIHKGKMESALNYFKHLMRYKDDRFSQHNRFRYFALNSYMRWSALRNGNLFIKSQPEFENMTLTQLKEELHRNPTLIKKIMYRNSSISGSKSYWFARGKELLSMVEQIGLPTLFCTFSAADLHWPELFKLLAPDEDLTTMSLFRKKQLVKNNPLIVDTFFLKRVETFMAQVVIKKYKVKDYWFRIEYQHRGSPHMHGVLWIEHAPDVTNLKNKSDEEQEQIVQYFAELITAFHPNIDQPPSLIHPCQKSLLDVEDLDIDLAEILNRVQRHTMCSRQYCIRKSKRDKQMKCRFNFPQVYQEQAKLQFDENGNAEFLPQRNDERLNKYNAYMIQTWRANMDVAPVISKTALVNYLAKYISKSEIRSDHLGELMKIINEASDKNKTAKYAVQRLYIKACSERDFSAQETCHLLMGLKLHSSGGREFITINCNENDDWRLLKNDDCSLSLKEKYQYRSETLDAKCLYEVAKCYILPSERKRTKQAILQIYPKLNFSKYVTDQTTMEKFYRQQVLLFVPWRTEEQLKGDKATWKDVFDECTEIIKYNSTNVFNINDVLPDKEEFEEAHMTHNLNLEEWMAVSAMGPSENIQTPILLGSRDIDTNYNWHEASALYEKYGGIPSLLTFISRMKKEYQTQTPTFANVTDVILNEEQQQIMDLLLLQIASLKNFDTHCTQTIPKSAIIQGKAGTGKSLVIAKMTKLMIDSIGPCSYLLLGPTGVSAVNINGSTIHSKLHIRTEDFKHLNGQQLHTFKEVMAPVKFVIIDEFSMVGCEFMYMIDQRLRQGKDEPNEPFGGLFLYMFGDINQLPPVIDKPIYTTNQKTMEAIAGKILYDSIDTAFILENIHRQKDHQFQNILNNISSGNISGEDYKMLETRFTTNVHPAERKLFDDAPHFYPTNREKDEFNYGKLKNNVDQKTMARIPVAKITAKISGNSKAISLTESDSMESVLYLSKGSRIMLRSNLWVEKGLVNGSVGEVLDIIYHPDATPQDDPPSVIICTFTSYKGPYLDPEKKTIPIGPTQISQENGQGEKYTVSQFPLSLNYACTIYKSQGLTMDKDVEYDPFAELDDNFARARPINTVTPGKEYKVTNFLQMRSTWKDAEGSYPMNTLVQYYEEGLKFQSILPRKFNNKPLKWIETMNKLIENKMNPKVVYYGTVSLGYEVDLLRHTQSANPAKLEIVQKIQAQCQSKKDGQHSSTSNPPTPTKRSSSSCDESPTKFAKKD
ncbi:ATP-dependent DNA helicase [Frankliniella fusca]|uniref:ATP-dependent DNA helicase n=1 Tax=Frankliniella fusca TaxID=407009 RepID=A0AAE1LT02_9NEOP|nr:ATP-dependent DNA helicase [Frankliniella fusca]